MDSPVNITTKTGSWRGSSSTLVTSRIEHRGRSKKEREKSKEKRSMAVRSEDRDNEQWRTAEYLEKRVEKGGSMVCRRLKTGSENSHPEGMCNAT